MTNEQFKETLGKLCDYAHDKARESGEYYDWAKVYGGLARVESTIDRAEEYGSDCFRDGK